MKEDEELRQSVMEAIRLQRELRDNVSEIGISAKDGVVTLSGYLDSYAKKIAAEDAALQVPGVVVLACDLEVKVSTVHKRNDQEISEDIRNALKLNSDLVDSRIKIKVDQRWVYLNGYVRSKDLKAQAEQMIRNITNVRGVTSNIAVEPDNFNVLTMQDEIASGFHRMATKNALSIKVKIEGSKATLEGNVNSEAEKSNAEAIAKNFRGITAVENKIKVGEERSPVF